MKKHSSRGKRRAVFAGLLFAAVLTGGAMLLSLAAKDLYWKAPHLENALSDLSEYEARVTENDSGLDEIEETVHACNEAAAPVRPEFAPFFEGCDQMIRACFQDVFQVDVTDRLNALQVMESSYPEEVSQMVGGSHSSDFPGKLFINAEVLEDARSELGEGELPEAAGTRFSTKLLRNVYIHEVTHYLGVNSDTGFHHFTEALAEFLCQEVMEHSGVRYESITGYAPIQGFAAQIASCDPALVREALTSGHFDMKAYFNRKLGGDPGVDYGKVYDGLIGLLQKGDDSGGVRYHTQYLTYEYCKAANGGAREILNAAGAAAGGAFELKWLLGIHGSRPELKNLPS